MPCRRSGSPASTATRRARSWKPPSKAIRASNALDASDLISGGPRTISLLVEAAKNIDPESRDVLLRALAPLANLMAQDTARSVASRFSPKPKA